MSNTNIEFSPKVQNGEHGKIYDEETLAEAKYYVRSFGLTCIFESTSNDDLKYVWDKPSEMPSELYPLVVELAIQEATEWQQKTIEALSYDNDDDYPEEDRETPGQRQGRFDMLEKWKKMSPREFWMYHNGPIESAENK